MPAASRKATLYVVVGLGVASFALSPILVRWAEAAGGTSGIAIAAWRTGLATLLLAPVAWPGAREQWREWPARDAWLTAAAGALLGLHFVCWIESLYHTSVASSTVLVTTSPVILAVLGYLLLGERLRAGVVGAIVVAVAGAALIAYGDAGRAEVGTLLGNALAFGAALLASGYLLIGRVVRQRAGWLAYVFPLYAASAATTLAVALWQGAPMLGYDWPFYAFCLAMAVGPQLIGHGAFNYALQSVPAALVGMLALLEPVGASLLAFALFGETPPPPAVAGMLVVLAATGTVVLLRSGGEDGEPKTADGERAERDGEREDAGETVGSRK